MAAEPWYRLKAGRKLSLIVILVAVVGFALVGVLRLRPYAKPDEPVPVVTVPLFVDPEKVDHRSRFAFSFDDPEVLAPLREAEGLDGIVSGSGSDQETFHRLMGWVRAQWRPGRPDPYPPPDARIILRDIRAGVTGGFCAQYSFVLAQAIQSFGSPARLVTIEGHEVVEAWLGDEQRWVMFDPTYELQVVDGSARTLSALEIRRSLRSGEALRVTSDRRLSESVSSYLARYRRLAVWLRNDFVGRPMNFQDFERYMVFFRDEKGREAAGAGLETSFPVDLYPEPAR